MFKDLVLDGACGVCVENGLAFLACVNDTVPAMLPTSS